MRRSTAVRLAAAAATIAGAATPLVRRRLGLHPVAVSVLAWQAPLALVVALPRSRPRDAAVYALQMWAYIAHYEMPNDDPELLRARLRIRYPIVADRIAGLGLPPTVRLQRAFARERIRPHDVVLSIAHWLWYFAPHAAVAYVLVRRPRRFPEAATLVALTFDLGLVVYWAVPTAPPWWAGQNGHMEPVRRIMLEVGERFWGRVWNPLYDSLAGNPFAAMPSLHFATSVAAARALSAAGPRAEAVGWAYAGTLGVALVYLGEHYVVDLAAGYALVEVARRLSASRALRALGAATGRLELAAGPP